MEAISLLVFFFCMTFLLIIGLALYIIASIGLMGFAKRRGLDNTWLAWLPFANLYLIGRMFPGGVIVGGVRLQNLETLLPAAAVAVVLIPFIPFIAFISTLLSIALYVLLVYLCNLLFREYRPGSSLVYAVFFPIGFFLLRSAPRVNVGKSSGIN